MACLLLAACGAPAPAPIARPAPAESCDVSAALRSSRRAWLPGATTPVVVIETAAERVLVAHVTPDIVVTRWVPTASLGRAVSTSMAVSPMPGGRPDPDLVVLPGFPVAPATTPWVRVASTSPLAFEGYIPSGATTTIFEALPPPREPETTNTFEVRAEPTSGARLRGVIGRGAHARTTATAVPGWLAVTAAGPFSRISGFVLPPPPRVTKRFGSIDFEDDLIEGRLEPSPLPTGTCLRDARDGAIVGATIGPLLEAPRDVSGGVVAITAHAPWGETSYFARAVCCR